MVGYVGYNELFRVGIVDFVCRYDVVWVFWLGGKNCRVGWVFCECMGLFWVGGIGVYNNGEVSWFWYYWVY